MEELLQFISLYMTKEELLLAVIGAIFIIIWFLGGKEQKEMETVTRKVDELRSFSLAY